LTTKADDTEIRHLQQASRHLFCLGPGFDNFLVNNAGGDVIQRVGQITIPNLFRIPATLPT
jgi:hypothetical protein